MHNSKENHLSRLPVFVYGTLRPGEKNFARYLGGRCVRILPATTNGALYFVRNEGYPYLTDEAGTVRGDLIFLAPSRYHETLRRLDQLEEYRPQDPENSVYLRKPVTAITADGKARIAWTYFWNLADLRGERILGGDFCNRVPGP